MKTQGSSCSGVHQGCATVVSVALLAMFTFLLLIPLYVHADTAPCGAPDPLASGYLFSSYESDEYSPNGLLTEHFKILPPYTEGRTFKLTWYYYDDGCNYAFNFYDANTVNVIMPAGVTDWSVRYATPTHLDVWDDQNNTIITQKDVEVFPPYTSTQFIGSIDGGASILQSRTLKIKQNGQPPQVATSTLAKDPACPSMLATGYYFDSSYEHAEYVDHLLRVHLRLHTPYNDGRLIWMQMLSVDASCNRDASLPFLFSMPRATITPHIRYYSVRMTTPTHWVLWDDESDVQIVCSFGILGCEGDISPDAPFVSLYGNIDQGQTILLTTPYSPVEQVQTCTVDCNDNVLFLPGIEASRLYRPARPDEAPDTTHRLWEPNSDLDIQPLLLNADGTSIRSDIFTSGVLDEAFIPFAGPNIYKSFINQMNTLKSTGKIKDWSAAPYDWRLSLDQILNSGTKIGDDISYTATSSDPYILHELMRLASSSRTGKVTIIAHSNGGLVAKALMIKLGPDAARYVDKIIFVAVPQVGTPSAIAGLLHGYGLGIPYKVSDSAMRQLGNDSPTAYNLLPSFDYFSSIADPVVTFDTVTLPDWVSRYGSKINLEGQLRTFLTGSYEKVASNSSELIHPAQLSDNLLTQAEAEHALLDAWTPSTGVQLIQIAGWGIPTTLSGIQYASTSKSVFCSGICAHGLTLTPNMTVDGDGTVVVPSALWTSATVGDVTDYWVDLRQYNIDHPFQAALPVTRFDHKRIFETDPIVNFLSDQITGTVEPLSSYDYLYTHTPSSTGAHLRYALHSPLTLNLYDDQGRHTGVSTTTGEIEEQIPGTYYTEFGDVKYIFTDASTTAHIIMNGYAPGTFTFNIDQYAGDTHTASTTFQDIPTTASTTVMLDVQSDITTLSPMNIDKDGNGTVDMTIIPKLNDTVTLDTTSPELQITFSTSTNALTVTATDDMGTTTLTSNTTYPILKKGQTVYRGIATTTVTARDTAGNTTALVYTEKLPSPDQRDTIIPIALVYNGATTTLTNTSISYKWRFNTDHSYKLFAGFLQNMSTTTESHYRPKKNKTIIMTKPQDLDDTEGDDDVDIRPIKQTVSGMVVPYIQTRVGSLIISY